MKTRYCPECGRSIPLDARLCPYCTKTIPMHDVQIVAEPEEKKDKTVLIIVAVVVILLIVPIAIAATVYVYVSGMMGSSSFETTPSIYFTKSNSEKTLTVLGTDYSSPLRWSDIEIQGTCDTSGLDIYVSEGDVITDCFGSITIRYSPSKSIIGVWTFT